MSLSCSSVSFVYLGGSPCVLTASFLGKGSAQHSPTQTRVIVPIPVRVRLIDALLAARCLEWSASISHSVQGRWLLGAHGKRCGPDLAYLAMLLSENNMDREARALCADAILRSVTFLCPSIACELGCWPPKPVCVDLDRCAFSFASTVFPPALRQRSSDR